ncbi:MAG: DUF1801 domain-containing protein [Chloroflexi bacterium]|nr:DUF1801 domain-containing protein [Chloroflexota bacterium]
MATVDEYLAGLPDDRRKTAESLRAAVLSAEPGIRESVKWGQPVFDVNGPVVALKSHAHHATLTFWRGASLDDPDGILEGDGDRMRHARFTSPEAVPVEAVEALVRHAAALNRELGDPTKRG